MRKIKRKVFVIGRNKTGTTSLGEFLSTLGYKLGNQARAEELDSDWALRRFDRIVNYCKTADAFQDVPFSNDFTYQALDSAFSNAKFILTVRDSPEEWYDSLLRNHTKLLGKGHLPTPEDLKESEYRHKGWLWRHHQFIYGDNEDLFLNKNHYIRNYTSHNERVIEYFRYRPDDFMQINIADADSGERICDFLSADVPESGMPHLNRSR